MSNKPIILFASANEPPTSKNHLRHLNAEFSTIQDVFHQLDLDGKCEVKPLLNPDYKKLMKYFLDYGERIVLFHYAGHANSSQWMLNDSDGINTKQIHVEGVIDFLKSQKGLQLVFLNACSTNAQAADIALGNQTSVIGTCNQVNDETARIIAYHFYHSFTKNKTLNEAWLDAVNAIKMVKGTANLRDLTWDGNDTPKDISDLWIKHFQDAHYQLTLEDLFNVVTYQTSTFKTQFADLIKQFIGSDTFEKYIPRLLRHHSFEGSSSDSDSSNQIPQILESNDRIVILGNAGVGKTTELKYAVKKLQDHYKLYPIPIRLHAYSAQKDIVEILPSGWKQVPKSKLVLLFDGLDEVSPDEFSQVLSNLNHFSSTHKEIKIVITCRTNFYYLPNNKLKTSLSEFVPYHLLPLSKQDIDRYINTLSFNKKAFWLQVYHHNFDELLYNPFFLHLILNNYQENGFKTIDNQKTFLKKSIEKKISVSLEYFQRVAGLEVKKQEIHTLLRRLALVMEMMGTTTIKKDELLRIIPEENNQLIKSLLLEKKSSDHNFYSFEHRNFQEALCAELLSQQSFELVIDIISFPNYNKIFPFWQNTTSLLLSILERSSLLFQNLRDWLIQHDSEILVKTEKVKLSLDVREVVFQEIFISYKEKGIWISSNKFSDEELATFSQSNKSINFLLDQLTDDENNRTVKINALLILRHYNLDNYDNADRLLQALLKLLNTEQGDNVLTNHLIDTINSLGFHSSSTIDYIMKLFGEYHAQYIRIAIYELLLESDKFENHTHYFLLGLRILYDKTFTVKDRDTVIHLSEEWLVKKGLQKFKTYSSLKTIVQHFTEHDYFSRKEKDFKEVIEKVIDNTINLFNAHEEIFEIVLLFFQAYYRFHRPQEINSTIYAFFERTNTEEKAFDKIFKEALESTEVKNSDVGLIAYLFQPFLMSRLRNAYYNQELSDEILQRIYLELRFIKPKEGKQIKDFIDKVTTIVIEEKTPIDWELIRQQKNQQGFDLLFDREAFKKECLRVFEDKSSLPYDDLYEIRKQNRTEVKLDDIFNDAALSFLRDYAKEKKYITNDDVITWMENQSNFERYAFQEMIYTYLNNHDKLHISNAQLNYFKQWYNQKIEQVDFKQALKGSNQEYNLDSDAAYVSFLIKKFDFYCPERILLDMLSFTTDGFIKGPSFEEIISKLSHEQAVERIIDNINSRTIWHYQIYENHVNYVFEYELKVCYDTIIEDILDDRVHVNKNQIIDNYLNIEPDSINQLKIKFDRFLIEQKLHIIKNIITVGDLEWVVNKLLSLRNNESNPERQLKINHYLLSASSIEALDYLVNWIETHKTNPLQVIDKGLAYFTDIKTLPYLIRLLEYAYDKTIKGIEDRFHNLQQRVIEALEVLALYSIDNANAIFEALETFISTHRGKLQHVEFINASIESMKNKVYQKHTVKYDLEEALGIINRKFS